MVEARTAREPAYGGIAKTLHWLILVLLIAQYTVAWTMPDIGRDTQPETLINLHMSFGITVIIVAFLRVVWRLAYPVPLIRDNVPLWQHRIARLSHALLYLLLFVLPLLGWLAASFRGWTITVFGLITLPHLAGASPALAGRTGDIHTLVSYLLLGLVGLHVLAALYHHFWLRDRVLSRMLPGNR
ncbi:MAG TPA: cytochrome b [Stellaceae bacterium]|jgi:cytochrome b561